MAIRGRKPKPTGMKILEGNPGKRKLNTREPNPGKKLPSCPMWLHPDAKKEWKRLAGKLNKMGILSEVDMASFAAYCQAFARWKEAEEYLTANGTTFTTPNGYVQQLPQVSIAQTSLKLMNTFASNFGLNPSTRSRLIAGSEGKKDTTDEMENILELVK